MNFNQKGSVLLISLIGSLIVVAGVYIAFNFFPKTDQTETSKPETDNSSIPEKVLAPEKLTGTASSEIKLNQETASPEITVSNDKSFSIKIINGDLVKTSGDKEVKLTSWGYNSYPLLSPDDMKVAYISKTKESLENEKIDQGYIRTSSNVWIINADGSDAIQLTKHIDFVHRGNLIWLDANNLLFSDGSQSVKIYNVKDKTTRTILGSENPVPVCADACGYETHFVFNPDHTYLIRLVGGYSTLKTGIVNLTNRTSRELDKQFFVNFDSVNFPSYGILEFKEWNDTSNKDSITSIELSSGKTTTNIVR